MCRGEISRSCSVLVGALIRNAQIAGIDAENELEDGSLLSGQFRRHLWCQLCFLDLRTAEARGPQPVVPALEPDTSLPFDVNDNNIAIAHEQSRSYNNAWTDSTFSLIRYECYEIHRLIFRGRQDIKEGRVALDVVAKRVNEGRSRVERLYLRKLDESVPIQRCAKLVGEILIARFDMMLFQYRTLPVDRTPRQEKFASRFVGLCVGW